MSPTAQAIILLSRGGYSHAPQKQLSHLVASLQSARPDTLVLGAMVDKGHPEKVAHLANGPHPQPFRKLMEGEQRTRRSGLPYR